MRVRFLIEPRQLIILDHTNSHQHHAEGWKTFSVFQIA